MPSVKKTEPSRKSKAAILETKSSKQRSAKSARAATAAKSSRSKMTAKMNAKAAAKTAAKAVSKAAAKTVASKDRAKTSSAAKKKSAAATARRRSEARKAPPASRRATAKPAAGAKTVRVSAGAAAANKAARAQRASAAASNLKQAVKPGKSKNAKAETAARIKRQEKAAAAVRVSRKKPAAVATARARVVQSGAAKPVKATPSPRNDAASRLGARTNVAAETVVVMSVEPGPKSTGVARAIAPEAKTVTLETSDHHPVTQKIQKKTAATPVAGLRSAAEKLAGAPASLRQAVKPAGDKTAVAETKLPEARPPVVAPAAEVKAAEAAVAAPKPVTKAAPVRPGFKTSEFIVYPAHGVGQIIAIEEQEVAGFKLELFVISFVKDKMILKVPVPKATSVGMRKLGSADVVKKALATLTGRARVKRTMWSRRAQEYEAKINSGDLVAIAEVVRDLYRSEAQPEQSYSERQLYEAALDRVAREISVVQKLTETESLRLIEGQLQKGPRRGKAEEAEGDAAEEGDIEEAA